jgi:hypothetical protein
LANLFANVGGQLIDVRVIPIPVRADCTVRIFGIPHDLSRAEAEKIGRVILALTQVDIHAKHRDVKQARPVRVGSAVLEEDAPEPGSNPHIQEVGE